jgi:hypothetical protein
MGIEYTLVNHRDKTLFELGKGGWYVLVEYANASEGEIGAADLLYEDSVYDLIIEDVFGEYGDEVHNELDRRYYRLLAKEIIGFVNGADPKDIALTRDTDGSDVELELKSYTYVGTRYYLGDTTAVAERIAMLNQRAEKNRKRMTNENLV